MSHHRLVPAGAVIKRAYLAIPQYATTGEEFPNTDEGWDAAVTAAQAKKAALVESLTEELGRFATAEEIEQTANVQVRIDLRWKIEWPVALGGPTSGVDTIIESYQDVDTLRTNASFKAHA